MDNQILATIANAITVIAETYTKKINEAPASINFKTVSPNGFEIQMTIRSDSMATIIKGLPAFEEALLKTGYTPAGRYYVPPAPAAPAAPAAPTTPPADPTPTPTVPTPPAPAAATDPRTGSFAIDSIEYGGKTKNGTDLFKVKGGPFMQWGLAAYPEAFATSGIVADPANPPALIGWIAKYDLAKRKVTGFIRAN